MRVFNYTGHKKLWNWVAEHPTHTDNDYFEITGTAKPLYDSYGCEFVKHINKNYPISPWCHNFCPLAWGVNENGEHTRCTNRKSTSPLVVWSRLYSEFMRNRKNIRNLRNLISKLEQTAREIANLPLRTDLPFEFLVK